ncbi:MAG: thermonuclease family protein [Acinetobacter sp.]|nr:thermonuclease family protein [Acinetobacter sp.]
MFSLASVPVDSKPTHPKLQEVSDSNGLVRALVFQVYDGDGCRVVLADGSKRTIRLFRINAPEFENKFTTKTQPYAKQSRDSLRSLILDKYVYLDTLPYPKVRYSYGRLVANVYTTDSIPLWINQTAVINGWAWYDNVDKDNKPISNPSQNIDLFDAHTYAVDNQLGLWGMPGKKLSPTYWRKKYKRRLNAAPTATGTTLIGTSAKAGK